MTWFECNPQDQTLMAQPTVSTASGSIATFDTDMTENLVEVKCQIVAQQSGSGTPSPDNVRPITTYTEMNVVATGKNLTTIFTDGKVPSISTGELVNAGGGRSNFVPVLPNTYYTFSIASTAQNLYIFYYDGNHGFLSYDGGNTQTLTGRTPNNCAYIMLRTASNASSVTDAQLEKGSSATAYEPYNGTTANIPFGQTVAQGLLNVGTGKLRVTWGEYIFNGSENWTASATPNRFSLSLQGLVPVKEQPQTTGAEQNLISSIYGQFVYRNANQVCYVYKTAQTFMVVNDTSATTVSDIQSIFNGTQLIYELETPIEIQLDSVQIQALLNENNIWCDTGDTEVKYLLTVGKKIA